MKTTARDVMETDFNTLRPDDPIAAAINIFRNSKSRGRTVFGIMVTNDAGEVVGMLSMYDILLLLLPKHVKIWGNISDIEIDGIIEQAVGKLKHILVGDIMTPQVVSISPDTHLMMILDIMVKKHIRRIPVVSEGKAVGMVYISDLFRDLIERA